MDSVGPRSSTALTADALGLQPAPRIQNLALRLKVELIAGAV